MRLPSPSLLALAISLRATVGRGQQTAAISSPEICESKTINYITHTLPQQCLRTNWVSANSSDEANATTVTGPTSVHTAVETGTNTAEARTGHAEESPKQNGTEEKKDGVSGEAKGAEVAVDDSEDLATSSFMSFEEWKAVMLQKSGQDPADIKGKKHHEAREGAEHGSNEVLDNWGDDGEIALNFDVLSDKISDMTATAGAKGATASGDPSVNNEVHDPAVYNDGVAHYRRPKDAGKTCKERFSYSSFDGGATVLKTSPGAKNAKAILVENKDSYMLFTCSQDNKFVIVELSEDILVDTVVLANFEFFSSMFRRFRVSVSDKYPVKMEKWKDVGTFQARNSRDIQSFLIENPKIWAKYIRIEFLSHYGNEYYCPVSLLRVHGTRMLDSWKDAEAGADDDEPVETVSGPEPVPEHELSQENTTVPEPEATNPPEPEVVLASNTSLREVVHDTSPWYAPFPSLETCSIGTPTTTGTGEAMPPAHAANSSSPPVEPVPSSKEGGRSAMTGNSSVSSTTVSIPSSNTSFSFTELPANNSRMSTSETQASSTEVPSSNKTQTVQQPVKSSVTAPKPPAGSKSDSSASKSSYSSKTSAKQPTHSNQNRNGTGTASSAMASPTVQESFFKSISKRLQFLESNTTLSLQYIEDQSQFLQQALQKMERRQISRVDAFLGSLNNTVLGELRNVRQQYDQIWQSTVLALETQREQSDREITALGTRLNLLADELVFQKRMAIFQSVLLLCCLVLVLFSRGVLSGGGPVAEQWPMTSQFFNSYMVGSPRWPPASPKLGSPQSAGSRGNSPALQRRASTDVVRGDVGLGRTLHPDLGGQRSASGHVSFSRSASYTDKMLPLTPKSEVYSGDERSNADTNGSPPPRTTGGVAAQQAPRIRVDRPEPGPEPEADEPFGEPDRDLGRELYAEEEGSDENSDIVSVVTARTAPIEEGEEDPSEGEDSSSGSAATLLLDRREESPAEIDGDVGDDEGGDDGSGAESKPPLTRSPLSELGLGIHTRKPLPALPEDPI